MELVKTLMNGRSVIFDMGRFDSWCVYVVEADGSRKAPHDEVYFSELLYISNSYKEKKLYHDFLWMYQYTLNHVASKVIKIIDHITSTYHKEHQIQIEQWFTVIYAGMIAEENKKNAILKKRVKRLGMYQTLMLDMPPSESAKFSYGKGWKELDKIMRYYGI